MKYSRFMQIKKRVLLPLVLVAMANCLVVIYLALADGLATGEAWFCLALVPLVGAYFVGSIVFWRIRWKLFPEICLFEKAPFCEQLQYLGLANSVLLSRFAWCDRWNEAARMWHFDTFEADVEAARAEEKP